MSKVHVYPWHFQDANLYNKKVTWEEVERFDQPL